MANTVLGNTAAALSGKFIDVGINAGVKSFDVTLTNAQIKAGGTIELVAAEGGKLKIPLWATLSADFTAGAYTNVHSGGTSGSGQPYVSVETNAESGFSLDFLINVTAEGETGFTDLFTSTVKKVVFLGNAHKISLAGNVTAPYVQNLSDIQGNIVVGIFNAGDGAFMGGNSANTLRVIGQYIDILL